MRSFWIGLGWGIGIGATRSLALLALVAVPGGLDTHGTILMIAAGVSLALGVVVGMLGARFAQPSTTDGFPWAGLGAFLLALFILHPLLTFAIDSTVTSLAVH